VSASTKVSLLNSNHLPLVKRKLFLSKSGKIPETGIAPESEICKEKEKMLQIFGTINLK